MDFQLRADGEHNIALLRDVSRGTVRSKGERVVAIDREESLWAVVTAVDVMDGTMLLAVSWEQPVNAA